MAAQKKEQLVNFLPQQEFAGSTAGRILTWAISTFRIIVIITEVVVVMAFLSRFWLDARLTDLDDEIKEKESVILSFSSFEKEFKSVQKKLKILKFLIGKESMISDMVKNIASILPSDISLKSLSIKEKEIEIKGTSGSEQSIAQLVANLGSLDSLTEVSLAEVSSKSEDQFLSFTINSQLKEN